MTGNVVNEKGEADRQGHRQAGIRERRTEGRDRQHSKGEWGFIGLGTGNVIVTASADGFLDSNARRYVQQLEKNPPVKLVLSEDKEKKVRVQGRGLHAGTGKRQPALTTNASSTRRWRSSRSSPQVNPNVYQIYFNIGDVYREKGEFDKANEQYAIAQAKAKEKADVVMQAKALASCGEVCLRQEKFKEAQDFFTQSIALNPKDEILAYNVAEIFFGRNQTDKAIEYYQLAIQIKPEWSEPYLKMGYAYLNKGDMAKAVEQLERVPQARSRVAPGAGGQEPDRLAVQDQVEADLTP